jgi:predicted transcriptional regulator
MTLKKVKIIVEDKEALNKRWKQAMKGKVKSKANEAVISVPSWEILSKVLSAPRLQILVSIPQLNPSSISQLAKEIKRDFKNVYQDVLFLADLGLVELIAVGKRKTLIPRALYKTLELPLAA